MSAVADRHEPLAESIDALEEDIARELRRRGVLGIEIVRIFPPHDTGDQAEVLLLGHVVPGADNEPLTAKLRKGSTPIITRGW